MVIGEGDDPSSLYILCIMMFKTLRDDRRAIISMWCFERNPDQETAQVALVSSPAMASLMSTCTKLGRLGTAAR